MADGVRKDGSVEEKQNRSEEKHGEEVVITLDGEMVNASGHRDQLKRHYGMLSICGLALSVDNAWVVFGTSLTLSIFNGGPPGVLYEFLVAVAYYVFIGLSLSELASSIPSAGGVYHWASITPSKRVGRVAGFFAGSVNFFGWLFDLASIAYIMAQLVVQMYFLYHPDLVIEPWHLFVTLTLITWICIAITVFFNRYLPYLQQFGLFIVIFGGLVAVIVLAAMPKTHSSNAFVWKDFVNQTGWSDGVAFLAGVLNGAFVVGTVDSVSHIAEELPNPRRDLPRAIFAQLGLGTITAFAFGIALFYGISDLDAVLSAPGSFPLAEAFSQATGSRAATFGLLFIVFCSLIPCLIGTFVTVGRTYWALARDNATPFPRLFSSVNERLSCPVPATLFTGVMTTAFGAITLGSKTAFSDLAGSFIVLTTTSYAIAIVANLSTGRANMPPGHFYLGQSFGTVINVITVLLIVFFNVMFCFPFTWPTTVAAMNYNSVILAGVVALTAIWWFIKPIRTYEGPALAGRVLEQLKEERTAGRV